MVIQPNTIIIECKLCTDTYVFFPLKMDRNFNLKNFCLQARSIISKHSHAQLKLNSDPVTLYTYKQVKS